VRSLLRSALFGRWPRLGLAVRTALAATLAWQIALWLPFGPADAYPYYAPLGAVVGSYTTVRSSTSNSVRAVAGIVVGALLALAVEQLLQPGLLVVPVLVFLATLLAGWRLLGDQRSWVLTAALFVLVVGAADPLDYVVAYTGLTLLGGAVAVIVNAALPEVPLARSSRALHRLADVSADQLEELAAGLRRDEPPSVQEWYDRTSSVEPVREAVRATSAETRESLRGNLRGHRHRGEVADQEVAAVVLTTLAARVEELTELLVEVQSLQDRALALEDVVRLPTAQALTSLAGAVRSYPRTPGEPAGLAPELADGLREDLQRLSAAVTAATHRTERDRQVAGAVVTLVRRCLGALRVDAGPDPEAVLPTPWRQPGAGPSSTGGAGRGRWSRWREFHRPAR